MNELLPYEEQLAGKLADVTLPDENRGWDAMRKMLDEDDDVLPPPVNTGCRNRGLAGLLLLVAGLLVTLIINKTSNRHNGTLTQKSAIPAKEVANNKGRDTISQKIDTSAVPDTAGVLAVVKNKGIVAEKITDKDTGGSGYSGIKATAKASRRITKRGSTAAVFGQDGNKADKKGLFGLNIKTVKPAADAAEIKPGPAGSAKKAARGNLKEEVVSGKTQVEETAEKIKKDKPGVPKDYTVPVGTAKKNADTLVSINKGGAPPAKKEAAAVIEKPTEKHGEEIVRDNKIWLSGGLGLQQLIPVDGQKASPYNAFGRKGTLADYIPSLYLRLHQNKKFLQVEFKYGAPQYTKDIAYSTKLINYDSTTHITSSTVKNVKKTWYHQLPVSLHYQILPNLSVGVGAIFNKFQSAEVNQQLHNSNALTGTDSIVSNKIISVKTDSAFAKTYWQFMAEAQYAINRFSFGTRYSFGLQPYLTTTTPLGQTQKERNASLNVFLRFELLPPKKK